MPTVDLSSSEAHRLSMTSLTSCQCTYLVKVKSRVIPDSDEEIEMSVADLSGSDNEKARCLKCLGKMRADALSDKEEEEKKI